MADDQNIVVGDIVKLKSGGPALTVTRVNDSDEIVCKWWNQAASKFEVDVFQKVAVKSSTTD